MDDGARPSQALKPSGIDDRIAAMRAFIEANLGAPLSVTMIAEHVGLSPFYAARLFGVFQGESLIAYARRRRLQNAAELLADGEGVRLIDLAFDAGFDSQEAFTRAFKRAFGVAPGQFRRAHLAIRQGPVQMPPVSASAGVTLRGERVRRPAFRVAGLKGNFNAENRAQIPMLWERFVQRFPIAGDTGEGTYGLCWALSPDEELEYVAAIALKADAPAPEGLDVYAVPERAYVVFRFPTRPGDVHTQMQAAMHEIWGVRIPSMNLKVGGADFEFYPPEFSPMAESWIEYWIPLAA
jgi:AraC family transcriptional regulator